MVAKQGSVTGAAIPKKALNFANLMIFSQKELKASSEWLSHFQQRHGIKEYVQYGEAGAANLAGIKHARERLPIFIEREVTSKLDARAK